MFHEIIFHLLNIYRKDGFSNSRMLRRQLSQRLAHPEQSDGAIDLNYWINLCRSAGLLDAGLPPFPTLLAEYWWGYPLPDQIDLLVNGWLKSVKSNHRRKLRRTCLERLRSGVNLTKSEAQEAAGLIPLGLIQDGRLSELGWSALVERKSPPAPIQPENWQIESDRLIIPYPPDWGLLWDLETYLDPLGAGEYGLAIADLQRAVQRGASGGNFAARQAKSLTAILEIGIGQPVPAEILRRLAGQPELRLRPGPVLEASDPQILKELRKSKRLRPYLDQVLSPRHIQLPPWQFQKLLDKLRQMGWEVDQTELSGPYLDPVHRKQPGRMKRDESGLSTAERLYCLSLALFAEGFRSQYAPPPGLVHKLAAGLAPDLAAAADEHASAMLAILYPRPVWTPEVTPPALPEPALLDFLQAVIDREESIDILYQTSARHTPEYRHISPLILEQRNDRWYISAYCHNRRGLRLFRLDRLKIIDFYAV